MNQQLKKSLIEYHRARGFVLYDSFPLVGNDATVLFTNATITPFKRFFEDKSVVPHDYALIQRCLRVGGGAGGLDTAQSDPNYSSLFEMFGSGLFNSSYPAAVDYFLGMLGCTGLPIGHFRFTVPENSAFDEALRKNGVPSSSIFALQANGEFWQEWRFGKDGLVGKGLTAIFARENRPANSINVMLSNPAAFVEIGNLIHIYGKVADEEIVPAAHEGFEVGIGMGRLAIALEDKTLYALSPLRELMGVVVESLRTLVQKDLDIGDLRVIIDHLRSIGVLIQEGVKPGNKQQAFILRKLIRSLLEKVWLFSERAVSLAGVISAFAELDSPQHSALVAEIISQEERIFQETLERGRVLLAKNPSLLPEVLKSTYGIRESLLPLIVK